MLLVFAQKFRLLGLPPKKTSPVVSQREVLQTSLQDTRLCRLCLLVKKDFRSNKSQVSHGRPSSPSRKMFSHKNRRTERTRRTQIYEKSDEPKETGWV